jgi:hypothetical protein
VTSGSWIAVQVVLAFLAHLWLSWKERQKAKAEDQLVELQQRELVELERRKVIELERIRFETPEQSEQRHAEWLRQTNGRGY